MDPLPPHDVASGLAGVVGVVHHPVEPASGPPADDVEYQGGVDRLEVASAQIGSKLLFHHRVPVVITAVVIKIKNRSQQGYFLSLASI